MKSDYTDLSKFALLTDALMDELILELEDKDDEVLGTYMEMMGDVISWIGHGDDSRLPERLRSIADKTTPSIPIEA